MAAHMYSIAEPNATIISEGQPLQMWNTKWPTARTLKMELGDARESRKNLPMLLQEDIIFTLHVCNKNPIVTFQGDIGWKTNFQPLIVSKKNISIYTIEVFLLSYSILNNDSYFKMKQLEHCGGPFCKILIKANFI